MLFGDLLADGRQIEEFRFNEGIFGLFGQLPIHGRLLPKIFIQVHDLSGSTEMRPIALIYIRPKSRRLFRRCRTRERTSLRSYVRTRCARGMTFRTIGIPCSKSILWSRVFRGNELKEISRDMQQSRRHAIRHTRWLPFHSVDWPRV